MAILIIILLSIIIGILIYPSRNLILQNEQLEESTLFYQNKLDDIREKVLQTQVKLKELDIRGAFEADDEVGFVFQSIIEVSAELTKTVESTYEHKN